jgi:hypothetical protein
MSRSKANHVQCRGMQTDRRTKFAIVVNHMKFETSRVFRIISAIIEVALSVFGMSFKDLEIANALPTSTSMIRGYRNRLISEGLMRLQLH